MESSCFFIHTLGSYTTLSIYCCKHPNPVFHWQVYYVYGFMLLVFVILIIVTVCVTIVGTYFLLNAENYHWQWTSFFSAASTALYVFLYSIYYYYVKTKMSGFFQTSFYFGYTLMFCLGLGILCGKFSFSCIALLHTQHASFANQLHISGAVGYLGSNLFVRRIYRNIKCDWVPVYAQFFYAIFQCYLSKTGDRRKLGNFLQQGGNG